MKNSNSTQTLKGMDLLFSMLLFLVFILCAVFTILIGSRVYENIRARNDQAFYSDTAMGYITNKVRQCDSADSVAVREIDGCDVLILSTYTEWAVYETWIYTMDGSLKELFSEKDSGLSLEDGLDIMECSTAGFSLGKSKNGLFLTISLYGESGTKEARLALRSASKGGN